MSRKINPLTSGELSEEDSMWFDLESQRHVVIVSTGPRAGKRALSIERTCSKCKEKMFVPVTEVRRGIKKSKVPTTCRSCKFPGRVTSSGGYIHIYRPDHPRAYQGKYVPEHILVMEGVLGRYLDTKSESVHHINGDRQDNRVENLQLRRIFHGKGQALRCLDCGSYNVDATPLK